MLGVIGFCIVVGSKEVYRKMKDYAGKKVLRDLEECNEDFRRWTEQFR